MGAFFNGPSGGIVGESLLRRGGPKGPRGGWVKGLVVDSEGMV